MFAYIAGIVDIVTESSIVLDVGGVGFEIQTDEFTRSAAHRGERMRIYTHLRIADDRVTLYGFRTVQQKDLFLKLVMVSGVGPRVALAVLSKLSADDFVSAIFLQDEKALQGVPGVGKKTAQRILLEMRGKVEPAEGADAAIVLAGGEEGGADAASDAVQALEGLGYTRQEAAKAVAAVRALGDTAEDLVRLALKRMGLQ